MFGLPEQGAEIAGRIVVVSLGAASVGIVMDSVNAVLRVSRADVDATPPLLASSGDLSEIRQICRLDGGARLVSIVSATNLFRHSSITQALKTVDQNVDDQESHEVLVETSQDDDEQMVVFRLAKEEFGVPIECVQEIVRVPDELTQVPRAPAFVEGVINLRGAVLPVIDLRRRLGLASVERSDRQRVMVFVIDGVRTGYIVDSVAEVLRIHKSAIGPAPRLNADPEPLLARVANLQQQKRMVQLIAPSHLIDRHERLELAQLEA
jgi:purine-binding chemotaxis protein CheW